MIIEKADIKDLEKLKNISKRAVANMHENGLDLWNDYYPSEELESYINANKLFVLKDNTEIISFFALTKDDECSDHFKWNVESNFLFLSMFTINVDFLHKGYGRKTLELLFNKLKEENYKALKLSVYEKNDSAINLYNKMGFKYVEGEYTFINKFRDDPPKKLLGMEYVF